MGDGFVATEEMRWLDRLAQQRLSDGMRERVLQQRWVRAGTIRLAVLNETNSEWRDVPLVIE